MYAALRPPSINTNINFKFLQNTKWKRKKKKNTFKRNQSNSTLWCSKRKRTDSVGRLFIEQLVRSTVRHTLVWTAHAILRTNDFFEWTNQICSLLCSCVCVWKIAKNGKIIHVNWCRQLSNFIKFIKILLLNGEEMTKMTAGEKKSASKESEKEKEKEQKKTNGKNT